MGMNSPDYLTYKKSKQMLDTAERKTSKIRIAVWICLVTFSLCFAIFTNFVAKYTTRMDIEYDKNTTAAEGQAYIGNAFGKDSLLGYESDKGPRTIDSRLKLIQLEENAPSEARALKRDKNSVIDTEHYERITSGEDIYAAEKTVEYKISRVGGVSEPKKEAIVNVTNVSQGAAVPTPKQQIEFAPQTFSKVLVGKYKTFEDAKAAQLGLRNSGQVGTPFIRKIGEVYTLQVGSYVNHDVAKNVAQSYSDLSYDVWILQN